MLLHRLLQLFVVIVTLLHSDVTRRTEIERQHHKRIKRIRIDCLSCHCKRQFCDMGNFHAMRSAIGQHQNLGQN